MTKIFDFHFHMLFKHCITRDKKGKPFPFNEEIKTHAVGAVLNDLFGGPFNSQSSPSQVSESALWAGVTSIISIEYAFAERILHVLGIDFSGLLPLDADMIKRTASAQTTYWDEFNSHINYNLKVEPLLKDPRFNIHFVKRADFAGKTAEEIEQFLQSGTQRNLAFSIEGGHNFSNVPIRNLDGIISTDPEVRLKELQERNDIDFISINLCHLSDIPEQRLAGFSQGINKMSGIAFRSDYFKPVADFGISAAGKRFIIQALTHPTRPVMIDIKHMSLYSRLEYYRFREKLTTTNRKTDSLPIISSHTGFTFTTIEDYIDNKRFRSKISGTPAAIKEVSIEPENRKIGRTNDFLNKGLFCMPWTINLFDEEIVEIMQTGGLIGITIDQRVLGASNPAVDSLRTDYFEQEFVAVREWEKLFKKGERPAVERLTHTEGLKPDRSERHIMLFCLHLVHAVRVGYTHLNWIEGTSPWKHICIGTDFDGLINPMNGYDTIKDLEFLEKDLRKYLPVADKHIKFYKDVTALRYNTDGTVNNAFLNEAISDFLFGNGVRMMAKYLNNYGIK